MDEKNLNKKDTFIVNLLILWIKALIIGAFCTPIWLIIIVSFELLMSFASINDKENYRFIFYTFSVTISYFLILIMLFLTNKKT